MPQSLSQVTVHIVFSTKDRISFFNINKNNNLQEIHSYISKIIREMGSVVHRVGGVEDHVHIACTLPRIISQSEFIKKIKNTSSKWIKKKINNNNFYWQKGFGVFSVSQSNIERLTNYIDNQEEHHKGKTYKKEYIGLLKKHKMKYDEKYIWD